MKNIDDYIANLPAWQGEALTLARAVIHEAEPLITEDWKWAVPVFTYNGEILFAVSGFKDHVKLNFLTGAGLGDQAAFNNGLTSKTYRSIDIAEGESFNEQRITALVRDAVKKANGE